MTTVDFTTIDSIRAAFAPYRTTVAERLTAYLRDQAERLLTKLEGRLNLVYASECRVDRHLAMAVRNVCEEAPGQPAKASYSVPEHRARIYQVSETKLAAEVAYQTDLIFAKWEVKMARKLLGLTEVTVNFVGSGELTLYGRLQGRTVLVEQRTVYKYSKHNRMYLQWPARIYVDGKFTPEAAYKALCA